jgi:hypothetical protein
MATAGAASYTSFIPVSEDSVRLNESVPPREDVANEGAEYAIIIYPTKVGKIRLNSVVLLVACTIETSRQYG